MTVPVSTNRTTFVTNGVTTAFPIGWPFPANADLVVTHTPTGGSPTILTLNTHYTVAGAGVAAGGTVTVLVAPVTGSLEVKRVIALTQSLDLATQGPYSPAALTRALDREMMAAQQVEREVTDLDTDVTALAARVVAAEAAAAAATTALNAFTTALATANNNTSIAAFLAAIHTWTAKQTFSAGVAVDALTADAISVDPGVDGSGDALVRVVAPADSGVAAYLNANDDDDCTLKVVQLGDAPAVESIASGAGPAGRFVSSGSGAPVNIAPRTLPSTLVDGDIWVETVSNTLKVRISGSTKTVTLT